MARGREGSKGRGTCGGGTPQITAPSQTTNEIHNDQKLSFPPSQAPPHRATCANSTGGEGWESKQGGVFAFTW